MKLPNFIEKRIINYAKMRGLLIMPASQYTPTYAGVTAAGQSVNHDTALTFTGAFAAISIKAENLASLPKMVFEKTATGKKELTKHPVYKLIHFKPNNYQTDFVFWEFLESSVAGWGNGYAVIETGANGYPRALHPVHPGYVSVKRDGYQVLYIVNEGISKGNYMASEMLHVKLFTQDGIVGIDPITYHAQAIGIGMAGQAFASEYFTKKGALRAVVETEGELSDDSYRKVADRISQAGDHGTPILEYGLKYKGIGISPDAAQSIQTRIFSIQDASRIWKVPVSLLSEHTHSTFTNTEQQDIQFVKYGLRPECKRFETEIESKLFPEGESERINVKFDLKGLLRGDLQTQSDWYHKAILDGWMSRNEVRELENLDRIDGLDDYLVPANMTLPEALEQLINNNKNKAK
jgi:HK97 family phage portal protein